MKYQPILDAIKAILVADETANGLIKLYRFFEVETGAQATPVCVIGSTTEMTYEQSFLGDHSGSRPCLWSATIGISIFGRAYRTQTQLNLEAIKLDNTQAAVYTALNVDTSITSTVTLSSVERVHNVSFGEYFGHEMLISAEKQEG